MATFDYTVDPLASDFPMRIYRFLIGELRRIDQVEGGQFLERFLKGPQAVWEDLVAKIQALPEIWDVEKMPDSVLEHQKSIVGWTKEPHLKRITQDLDDDALRRLISVSGALWNTRGTESAMLNVIGLLTVARCRIWNWFDFRWVLGETGLSEEHEGTDPWVLEEDGTYTSNLRIMDDGTLDRTLVKRILRLMRAINERFEITYLLLLDLFSVPDDDLQWDHPSTLALVVADGNLKLLDETVPEATHAIISGAADWNTYLYSVRIKGESLTAGARFGFTFYRTSATNYYAVLVDTISNSITLLKVVGGVTTTIATVADMFDDFGFTWHEGVYYILRVSIVPEGASNRIVVSAAGYTLISATDNAHTAGSVGLIHEINATLECDEVEVLGLPSETELLDINTVP
jgi:phage tail-like protein